MGSVLPWRRFPFLVPVLVLSAEQDVLLQAESVSKGLFLANRTCPWQILSHPVTSILHWCFWHIPVRLYASGHSYSKCSSKWLQKCSYLFFGMFFLYWGLCIGTLSCNPSSLLSCPVHSKSILSLSVLSFYLLKVGMQYEETFFLLKWNETEMLREMQLIKSCFLNVRTVIFL